MRVVDLLEQPTVTYIIIAIFSVISAVIFFLIGGSAATVTGQEGTLIGVGFEAGGALAGFVIIFLLSQWVIGRLKTMTPQEKRLLREYVLQPQADSFDLGAVTFACKYRLFDPETGDWSEWKEIPFTREAGGLKIYVREMEPHHIIGVRLQDAQNNTWEPQDDHAYGLSHIYLKRVGANA